MRSQHVFAKVCMVLPRGLSRLAGSNTCADRHYEDRFKAWKQEFGNALNSIEAHGEFASHQVYTEFANPGLQVLGKPIALPLLPEQAKDIKLAFFTAPTDRGADSQTCSPDRSRWELEPVYFSTTNPAWQQSLDRIVRDLAESLGFQPSEVTLEPHKLLLCEKDSWCTPPKGLEQVQGVIGSLTLCLPTEHKGGAIHVWQNGTEISAGEHRLFPPSSNSVSPFDMMACSWYWDVMHEIKPIDSGHRLFLVYNIISKTRSTSSAKLFAQQEAAFANRMEEWRTHSPSVTKLVYFLDKVYEGAGLSIDRLRGRDRAVCNVLRKAARRQGFVVFIVNIVTIQVMAQKSKRKRSFSVDCMYSWEGTYFGGGLELNKEDVWDRNRYNKDREADEIEEDDYDSDIPEQRGLKYLDSVSFDLCQQNGVSFVLTKHNQALLLIPIERLSDLVNTRYINKLKLLQHLKQDGLLRAPNQNTKAAEIQFMTALLQKRKNEAALPCRSGDDDAIVAAIIDASWDLNTIDLYRTVMDCAGYNHQRGLPAIVSDAMVALTDNIARSASSDRDKWKILFGLPRGGGGGNGSLSAAAQGGGGGLAGKRRGPDETWEQPPAYRRRS